MLLPDVAHFRSHGCTGLRVSCSACGRSAAVTFDALGARETDTIDDLGQRRFACARCGGRAMTLMPDWPAVNAGGRPRIS